MSPSLATSLAFKASSASQFGVKLFLATNMFAQSGTNLAQQMGGALGILNLVGLVLAFGGLLFAAVMFMMGQTERMIYGLVGALIGGLSFLIVKAMFQSSDQNAANVNLGS